MLERELNLGRSTKVSIFRDVSQKKKKEKKKTLLAFVHKFMDFRIISSFVSCTKEFID